MSRFTNTLKLSLLGLFFAMAFFYCFHGTPVQADATGPPTGHSGAPGELTCNTSGCHTGNTMNQASGSLTITGLPANGYSPSQEVIVTVTLRRPNSSLYGFELTALDDSGKRAGDLVLTESNRTRLGTATISGNSRQYVEQNFTGASPNATGQNSWTLKWRAPAQSVGKVTLYAAGNAANGNGSTSGDFIYTATASVQPATPLQTVATVSAASYAQGSMAAEAMGALYGTGLAADTVVASTVPLPTTLGGVTVRVKDVANTERDSPLFFVSGGQINFLIPQGTLVGAATVTVLRDAVAVGAGPITVENVSPGFFAANANGQGVPAAVLLRVQANGAQIYEAIAQFNQTTSRFDPIAIDPGPDTDQLFLIIFGTGFRNRSALSNVSCAIGGVNSEVLFAGAQGSLSGLDQANIRIPRSLAGRGNVDLTMTVDGKTTNTVLLNIK